MKKLLLNFIVSLFCLLLAVAQVLATEYTEAANNLQVEWVAGDGTDVYNFTGDNAQLIRSERFVTVNITGANSVVVDNCSEHGCPGQYFNGQFTDAFAGADATTLAQHYPPWYGIRYPSTASNCVITSGAVACTPVLGSELLVDPGFDDASKWSNAIFYGVGWSVSGGTANIDNSQTQLSYLFYSHDNVSVPGKYYLCGITATETAGSGTFGTNVGNQSIYGYASSSGIRENIIKSTVLMKPSIYVNAGWEGSFDDFTVKEVIWSTFLSNVTDYKFKTEVKYSADLTIADGDIAMIAFKVGDLTAGSEDFCRVELNKGTGKVELKKVVAGTPTTPLSAAVTYSAGATLSVMSADGIKWVVVYNGSQVGTEQTISEASLDSSVAGFMATSASTTFDNWKAGRWQLGSELVTNGDGESLTGWTTTNGDLSSVVAGGAIGNCFKVSETDYGTSVIDSVVTFEAGKYYAFSVRVKRGSAGLFWTLVHRLTSLGNTYLNPSGLAIATSTDAPPTDWVKYARVAGFPAGTADVIGIIRAEDSGGSGAAEYTYFDEISIREIQ